MRLTPSLAGLMLIVLSLALVALFILLGLQNEAIIASAFFSMALYALAFYHFIIEKR